MSVRSFLNGRVTLHAGDMLEVLPTLAENSIDSCVCDPPYHLTSIVKRFGGANAAPAKSNGATGVYERSSRGFMLQVWDGGDIAFRPETWAEVLRVLKPGAHLLAFGAPKNYHRLAVAIEDGGFEIRDCLQWLFGSGFPKSHDVSKSIDRMLGAEREVVGKKQNNKGDSGVQKYAALGEFSQARFSDVTAPATDSARQWQGWGSSLKPAYEPIVLARKPLEGTIAANVLKHGVGAINIDGCRVATNDKLNGSASPPLQFGGANHRPFHNNPVNREYEKSPLGRWPANILHDGSDEVVAAFPETHSGALTRSETARAEAGKHGIYGRFNGTADGAHFPASKGSAARFFFSPKADSDDRLGSKHPTVKPLDLMQYLVRLITPPRGTILDPFAGTGTTGEAAWREGFSCTLIEREAEYVADIERRMALCLAGPDERARESIKARLKDKPQDHGPLFGEAAA